MLVGLSVLGVRQVLLHSEPLVQHHELSPTERSTYFFNLFLATPGDTQGSLLALLQELITAGSVWGTIRDHKFILKHLCDLPFGSPTPQ